MDGVFFRLAWKDIQLVRTLVYVLTFASVVCTAAIVIGYRMNPLMASDGLGLLLLPFTAIPFLAALGLPALLVGTEQESGTLAWLRTLPILRSRIIHAKLWVALAALFTTWMISSAALLIAVWALPSRNVMLWKSDSGPELICGLAYFSINFLLCGFIAAYLIRSPFAAIFVSLFLAFLAPIWIEFQLVFLPQSKQKALGIQLTTIFAGGGYLMLLFWLQHVIAHSRLRLGNQFRQSDPERYSLFDAFGVSLDRDSSASATHVNVRLSVPKWRRQRHPSRDAFNLWAKRAKPMMALLWQARSQQFWPVLGLTVLAIVFLGTPLCEPVSLLMCWIGSMTFYGDTVGKRHLYFASRPIDCPRIWLSRMSLPLLAIALITVLAWVYSDTRSDCWQWVGPGYFGFAIGALVSMAAPRPILGLLGGMALFWVALCLLAMLLSDYLAYLSWSAIAAVPVLFATWRLLPRWKHGLRGIGFDARVVAYVLLGILSLSAAIFGYRIASIPAEQTAWRMSMINDTHVINTLNSSDTKFDLDAYLSQRQTALTPWNIIPASSTRQWLTLSSRARQAILDGELDSIYLFSQIEKDEEAVLLGLRDMSSEQRRETLQDFPTASLRKASRQFALKQQWQRYQEQSWHDESHSAFSHLSKNFAGFSVGRELLKYPWERKRADRMIDLAVKETLEAIENDSVKDDRTASHLEMLWRRVRIVPPLRPYAVPANASPISLAADRVLEDYRRPQNLLTDPEND